MLSQYAAVVAGEWVTCICVMQWNIFDHRVSNVVFVILCFCKEGNNILQQKLPNERVVVQINIESNETHI